MWTAGGSRCGAPAGGYCSCVCRWGRGSGRLCLEVWFFGVICVDFLRVCFIKPKSAGLSNLSVLNVPFECSNFLK